MKTHTALTFLLFLIAASHCAQASDTTPTELTQKEINAQRRKKANDDKKAQKDADLKNKKEDRKKKAEHTKQKRKIKDQQNKQRRSEKKAKADLADSDPFDPTEPITATSWHAGNDLEKSQNPENQPRQRNKHLHQSRSYLFF